MAVLHVYIVVILLFSSVSARSVHSRAARQSPATGESDMRGTCMTLWISVFDGNVSTAERTDLAEAMSSLTPPIDEKTAKASSVLVLGYFFGGRARAQQFITCISKGTRRCTVLAPCRNGGKCLFDSVSRSPSQHYRCVCLPGYTGQACEQGLSACVSNPCQNGGACQNVNVTYYQCTCPALFKGKNCETRWLSEKSFHRLSSTVNTLALQVSGVEQKQEVEQRQRWTVMMDFMKNISTAFSARTERLEQEMTTLKDKMANLTRRVSFVIIKEAMTHSAAVGACAAKGLQLAIPQSQAENDRVGELCNENRIFGCWLGISDVRQEGKWVDLNGKPVCYTPWYINSGEPNGGRRENCGHILAGQSFKHTWNDAPCSSSYLPVCQSI